ncbi:MAG TPA: endonuclease/exonuclease/phosphatase family protein [Thermomicrobiales bacterium]|nr:endonuclease/exonuclease/phosphatase family protein [Thermomicrobiales bacterium]
MAERNPVSLRVMTYNIRHGPGNDPEDPKLFDDYDLERVGEVIRHVDPHIVALQEVDRLQERSLGVDQPQALGVLLEMERCFGANVLFKPGEYGVATLGTYPITSCENVSLPTGEGRENRGVLKASIHVPGYGSITVLNTHLQVGQPGSEGAAVEERREQASVIGDLVSNENGPVILMGDFNAEPGDPELAPLAFLSDPWRLAGEGGGGCTIPSHPALQPSLRIDAIYVNEGFQVISSRVVLDHPARFASDHLPVVANLEIAGWKG